MDSLEEASSTGLLLQKKPMQSTCQSDALSRLIEIDPDVTLPTEPPGTEFGYNFF